MPEGQIVAKFPGTDFYYNYESGKILLNEDNTIGQVSLAIRQYSAKVHEEVDTMLGQLGRDMAHLTNSPEVQSSLEPILAQNDHHIFLSRTPRTDIITMPGTSGEYSIDAENYSSTIVAVYALTGEIPSAEKVFAHHLDAVKKQGDKLSAISAQDLLVATDIVNEVYVESLQLAENFSGW